MIFTFIICFPIKYRKISEVYKSYHCSNCLGPTGGWYCFGISMISDNPTVGQNDVTDIDVIPPLNCQFAQKMVIKINQTVSTSSFYEAHAYNKQNTYAFMFDTRNKPFVSGMEYQIFQLRLAAAREKFGIPFQPLVAYFWYQTEKHRYPLCINCPTRNVL